MKRTLVALTLLSCALVGCHEKNPPPKDNRGICIVDVAQVTWDWTYDKDMYLRSFGPKIKVTAKRVNEAMDQVPITTDFAVEVLV